MLNELERDDPSARIVHELVANVAHAVSECAAVDVSAVTKKSNMFYSNFCVDLTEKNARGKQ